MQVTCAHPWTLPRPPQICDAYRSEGGTTVVVLTQREKLEMEEAFRCVCVYMCVVGGVYSYVKCVY